MNRFLTLLLFVFLLTSCVHAEGKRAMQVVPKASRYALLVGINTYNKPFQTLKYCDADMESLEKALLDLGFPRENIVRLSSSATNPSYLPTKANILRHARLLADEVDEGGMFIVAFSGHGASFGEESYFCPMDAANKDLSSLVKRSDLYKIVEGCAAKQKLVFVDACRNSLVMDGWKAASGIKGLVDPVGIENPGFFIISSCKTGQYSWESPRLGHGVFTHFLVEGLQGKAAQDGKISVHGLFSYVNLNTKRYVRLNFEDTQIPLMRGDEEELDDFLLATLRPSPEQEVSGSRLRPEQEVSGSRLRPQQGVSGSDLSPQNRSAGDRVVFTVDGIDYAFRWCPPGEFVMGSPSDELGRYDWEGPQHKVKITQGFWLMETEVTQAMWESVMGRSQLAQNKLADNDTDYGTGAQYPVYCVSWDECQEFCRKLGQKLGQQVQLPTEAQWEYACRAGTSGAYAGNLDEMGWYSDNSGSKTHGVGSKTHGVGLKKPNAWGLYDMHGNVWEWCLDWFGNYTASPTSDPTGPTSGSARVVRGGGWGFFARFCRSASRYGNSPVGRRNSLGLRAVLVPVQ